MPYGVATAVPAEAMDDAGLVRRLMSHSVSIPGQETSGHGSNKTSRTSKTQLALS